MEYYNSESVVLRLIQSTCCGFSLDPKEAKISKNEQL
jgi:hypothetical protein